MNDLSATHDTTLSRAGRRELMRRAHDLQPVVMVGKHGITDELIATCDEALENHELVKVRFQNFKDQCSEFAAQIAERTRGQLIRTIGHVAILYRENVDPEKRRYNVR